MKRSNTSGFSLLELLVALGVLGIISSFAIAPLAKSRASLAHADTLRRLTSVLREAQLRAQLSGAPLAVLVSAQRLAAVPRSGPVLATTVPPEVALRVAGAARSITASPSGVISPFTLEVALPQRRCDLTVSLFGRITERCAEL